MNCQYVKNRIVEIGRNIGKIRAMQTNKSNPELNSMLDSYLVVLISGIYEDCVECLFNEKASKSQDQQVQNFVKEAVNRLFRNPSYNNIKEILNYFDRSYGQNLDSGIPRAHREAIDSIVNNKNSIAHGSISNATLLDLESWHQKAIVIFEKLDRILV